MSNLMLCQDGTLIVEIYTVLLDLVFMIEWVNIVYTFTRCRPIYERITENICEWFKIL